MKRDLKGGDEGRVFRVALRAEVDALLDANWLVYEFILGKGLCI